MSAAFTPSKNDLPAGYKELNDSPRALRNAIVSQSLAHSSASPSAGASSAFEIGIATSGDSTKPVEPPNANQCQKEAYWMRAFR
jgi:hypothetical protein